MTKFKVGDRIRQTIPPLGDFTGEVVHVSSDGTVYWQEDQYGVTLVAVKSAENLSQSPALFRKEFVL